MEAELRAPDHWDLGLPPPRVGVQRPECGQGGLAEGCAIRDAAGNRAQWRQFNKGTSSSGGEGELQGEGRATASLSQLHLVGAGPGTVTLPSLLPPAGAFLWANAKGATVHGVSWMSSMRRAGASGGAREAPPVPEPGCPTHPFVGRFLFHVGLCAGWGYGRCFLLGLGQREIHYLRNSHLLSGHERHFLQHPRGPSPCRGPGLPAAGASGHTPAAPGGRAHLGWRPGWGQEMLGARLLHGKARVPCKNIREEKNSGGVQMEGGHLLGGPRRSPGQGGPGQALEEEMDS